MGPTVTGPVQDPQAVNTLTNNHISLNFVKVIFPKPGTRKRMKEIASYVTSEALDPARRHFHFLPRHFRFPALSQIPTLTQQSLNFHATSAIQPWLQVSVMLVWRTLSKQCRRLLTVRWDRHTRICSDDTTSTKSSMNGVMSKMFGPLRW